jgi:acyl-CoA thioesterase
LSGSGIVDEEERKSTMDEIKQFIEKDFFAKHLGIEMLEYAPGKAKARMEIKDDQHLNSAGTVHGGAIFSLADAVFSVASNSHGTLAMAINVSISYFKAVSGGTLIAEGEEVSLNPKLATYLIHVKDQEGSSIALFQGTVYRKKESIKDIVK